VNDPVMDEILDQFKTLFAQPKDKQSARRALEQAWDKLYDIYRTWDMRHDLWRAAPAVMRQAAHLIHSLGDFERLCLALPEILDALPGGSIWNPAGDVFYADAGAVTPAARQATTVDEFLQLFLKRSA
jgi:hypothetical protein